MIDEINKTVAMIWSAQDVIDCAFNYYEEELSEEEAWKILLDLYNSYKCNDGMTLGHIESAIGYYLESKDEGEENEYI
jgi:hypothetical protein